MGTFGTGPFDSDGALDLIEDLAARPIGERGAALGRLLTFVLGNPDRCGEDFLPHDVIAATALVAAGLPDGSDVRSGLALVAPGTVLPAADVALSRTALEALASYAEVWSDHWSSGAETRAAHRTVERLVQILRSC